MKLIRLVDYESDASKHKRSSMRSVLSEITYYLVSVAFNIVKHTTIFLLANRIITFRFYINQRDPWFSCSMTGASLVVFSNFEITILSRIHDIITIAL